jgi:hypothetical protein
MTTAVNRWIAAASAAIIVAVALAAITVAQGSGVINACFKVQNGQLRLVNAAGQCLPSEQPISWNQEGVQGPQGPQGPQGAQGERGPSDAWDVWRQSVLQITGTTYATGNVVLDIALPAGKFAITSKVNISSLGSGGGLVRCYTKSETGWYDMGIASIGPNAGQTLEATLSTTFTAQEPAPGALTVRCWREGGVGSAPYSTLAEAVAIEIANVTTKAM